MTPDQLRERFHQEIDQRGRDDHYIDGIEERELMQIGVQHGYGPDQVRQYLRQSCEQKGYVLEAAVVAQIRDLLRSQFAPKGALSAGQYQKLIATLLSNLSGTARTEDDTRRLVVTTIDDTPTIRPQRRWFRDWFQREKARLGLV
ncbi:MAG: hypothetical protein ACRCZF_19905 [Gemmataceae bacterium]